MAIDTSGKPPLLIHPNGIRNTEYSDYIGVLQHMELQIYMCSEHVLPFLYMHIEAMPAMEGYLGACWQQYALASEGGSV
jgi:hypothetical protein